MEAAVYRVSPGPANTWRVSIGAQGAIASFNEKSAAVRYALTLAHGETAWRRPSGFARTRAGRRVPTGIA